MVMPEQFNQLGMSVVHLPELSLQVGENIAGRPGGAVSLAVGMAEVFSRIPGLSHLLSYWYHYAILFEALFILTTVDAGTRVARFLIQEMFGRVSPRWGQTDWPPSNVLSTLLVVLGWGSFIWTGSISTPLATIWGRK